MRLLNTTRGTVLAEDVACARSLWARMRGLLGRDEMRAGTALEIRPCTSVHSFFMRFAIDVVFVDKKGLVLQTIRPLRPWRLSSYHWRAAAVYELPVGAIAASGTVPGDVLATEPRA